jgi:hypothetical protein
MRMWCLTCSPPRPCGVVGAQVLRPPLGLSLFTIATRTPVTPALNHDCPRPPHPLRSPPSFWTLLDPTYAKKFIPIVASVSEHQPTTWASYMFDLHMLVFAGPAGLYFCFKKPTDGTIFLIVFALTAIYFSGVRHSRPSSARFAHSAREVPGGFRS